MKKGELIMTTGSNTWWRSLLICFAMAAVGFAQQDPGVRQGPPGAGAPLKGLTPIELSMFNEGMQRAIQLEAVCDICNDLQLSSFIDPALAKLVTKTNYAGLGTRFNGDQCLG